MKIYFTNILLLLTVNVLAQPCIPNTNSVVFDGFSSYVSISPQTGLDITSTITVEAWINPASFGFDQAQNSIACKHGWSSGEGGYVLRCGGNGVLSFNIAGLDTNQFPVSWKEVMSSTNELPLNTWTHVAGTYDGFEVKCYVNGILASSTPFIGSIVPSPSYPLTLGSLADPTWGPGRYFDGSMDEVRIWNRALSEAELQSGMNDHIDPAAATGLVSYWRMNEGANATLYDIAGTNNGGMIFSTWNTQVPFNSVPAVPVITYSNDTLYSSAPIGNQWYLDGIAIGGATQPFYLPQQNGIYTVEVTSLQGCTVMSADFSVTDVSVADLRHHVQHAVYPNPFQDKATLEISSVIGGEASIFIRDMSGRMVQDAGTFEINSRHKKIPLERKNLDSGIYIYEVHIGGRLAGTGMLHVN